MQLTLTFDNRPAPGITDRVLNILYRTGLKTTFFVIGGNLLDPDAAALMREAHSAGHWIGNHSLTHSVALGDRPEANYAREEIEEAQHLIGSCSRADKLFRPYGRDGLIGPHLFSEASLTRLSDGRYTCCAMSRNGLTTAWCSSAPTARQERSGPDFGRLMKRTLIKGKPPSKDRG
jgi:peptidoglycan-N-acetylglucosamine deacetylase